MISDEDKRFAVKMRQTRKAKQLSFKRLTAITGYTRSTLNNIELFNQSVSLTQAFVISSALGLSFEELPHMMKHKDEDKSVLNDALDTINILSDALDDIYATAKNNPMDRSSVSIRGMARKAIEQALKTMEKHDEL